MSSVAFGWLLSFFFLSPHTLQDGEAFQRLVLMTTTHYFKELIISPYYSVFHSPYALTISSLFPQFSHLHFKHKVFVMVNFIMYMLFYYVLASSYSLNSFPLWVKVIFKCPSKYLFLENLTSSTALPGIWEMSHLI